MPQQFDLAPETVQGAARDAAHYLKRHIARRVTFAGQVDTPDATLAQQAEDSVRTDRYRQAGGLLGLRVTRVSQVIGMAPPFLRYTAMLPAPV